METLNQYLLADIINPDEIEINDDFWLQPELYYWPSVKLMKELIKIAAKSKSHVGMMF